jgi:hypothetical protein
VNRSLRPDDTSFRNLFADIHAGKQALSGRVRMKRPAPLEINRQIATAAHAERERTKKPRVIFD